MGKILRITPATSGIATYTIPADNPFPTNLTLDRNEIFAIGLRNPFRWSFDRSTGDVWIGDVGQGLREEIDYVASSDLKGANFAWRCYEGATRNPAYLSPTYDTECGSYSNFLPRYDYTRVPDQSVSVIGGVIYRGTKYPKMAGYYVGSDFYTGDFHILAPSANTLSSMSTLLNKTDITDFGESEDGDIFAVSMSENAIFRFADATVEPLPVTLVNFEGRFMNEGIQLTWQTSFEKDFRLFEVEHSLDAKGFNRLGTVDGSDRKTGSGYQFAHNGATQRSHYYRLKMVDNDDTFGYSRIIHVRPTDASKGFVYPSVITNGTMTVNLAENGRTLELVNIAGHVLLSSDIGGRTGSMEIPVSHLGPGLYIARLHGDTSDMQQKVMIAP